MSIRFTASVNFCISSAEKRQRFFQFPSASDFKLSVSLRIFSASSVSYCDKSSNLPIVCSANSCSSMFIQPSIRSFYAITVPLVLRQFGHFRENSSLPADCRISVGFSKRIAASAAFSPVIGSSIFGHARAFSDDYHVNADRVVFKRIVDADTTSGVICQRRGSELACIMQ